MNDKSGSLNFVVLLYGLIVGVVFYDFIDLNFGFSYVDEIFVLILLVEYLAIVVGTQRIDKSFFTFIIVSISYLIYSLYLKVNSPESVYIDFLLFAKPFIAFYCVLRLPFSFSKRQVDFVRRLTLFLSFGVLIVAILGQDAIDTVFGHPSRLATACIILGVQYLIFSNRRRMDVIIAALIWSIALLSLKSKALVFFPLAVGVIVLGHVRFRDSRVIVTLALMMVIAALVGWEKFYFYFIQGTEDLENLYARPALYLGAWEILNDYLPFGPGLGTFASYGSAVFYSPLYHEYGLSAVYGLEQGGPFLHDAFLPQLAQFGWVGILLFVFFWVNVWRLASKNYYMGGSRNMGYKIVIVILMFFLIESPVDSTFVQNRGVYMMALLAFLLKRENADFVTKYCFIGYKRTS